MCACLYKYIWDVPAVVFTHSLPYIRRARKRNRQNAGKRRGFFFKNYFSCFQNAPCDTAISNAHIGHDYFDGCFVDVGRGRSQRVPAEPRIQSFNPESKLRSQRRRNVQKQVLITYTCFFIHTRPTTVLYGRQISVFKVFPDKVQRVRFPTRST